MSIASQQLSSPHKRIRTTSLLVMRKIHSAKHVTYQRKITSEEKSDASIDLSKRGLRKAQWTISLHGIAYRLVRVIRKL